MISPKLYQIVNCLMLCSFLTGFSATNMEKAMSNENSNQVLEKDAARKSTLNNLLSDRSQLLRPTLKQIKKNGKTRMKKQEEKFNTYFGYLTAWEIVAVFKELYADPKDHISIKTVHARKNTYENSIALYFPKSNRFKFEKWLRELKLTSNLSIKEELIKCFDPENFSTKDFCYRDNFLNKCIHYRSCEDSRCFNSRHHGRFKEDGTCYSQ